MKIVADENIPLVKNYFGEYGEIILKPGRAIKQEDLLDADILLVRSITKVDEHLLKKTKVKFVGSTTSGFDHINENWLSANSIGWSIARGCNAVAVAEYVVCVVAALQKAGKLPQGTIRAAVIGVGAVGEQVVEKLKLLNIDVTLCDPFRTDITATPFADLHNLDLISLHVPLTKTGSHPTHHLINHGFLCKQKSGCVLLNAARGAVVSFADLKKQQKITACLDVWEDEPMIDVAMLQQATIATPHIAGYSLQSKYRGIEMIYHAAVRANVVPERTMHYPRYPVKSISVAAAKDWRDVVLSVFNPEQITWQMKTRAAFDEKEFDAFRKQFADRYEFAFIELKELNVAGQDHELLQSLGLRLPNLGSV